MCREVQEDVPLPDSEYVHFPFFSEVRIELHLDGEIYYVGDTGLLTRRGETPTFFHPEQLEVTGSATFSRVEDDSHS
jgi:hypothetical protein